MAAFTRYYNLLFNRLPLFCSSPILLYSMQTQQKHRQQLESMATAFLQGITGLHGHYQYHVEFSPPIDSRQRQGLCYRSGRRGTLILHSLSCFYLLPSL